MFKYNKTYRDKSFLSIAIIFSTFARIPSLVLELLRRLYLLFSFNLFSPRSLLILGFTTFPFNHSLPLILESLTPFKVVVFSLQLLWNKIPIRVNLFRSEVILDLIDCFCLFCTLEKEETSVPSFCDL